MSELTLNVIGDSGPFSRLGKSIGYLLEKGDARYLVDCGAPIFQVLGADGLEELDGIIATHAHEDHKRWFTDIALYQKFNRSTNGTVSLYGSRTILDNFRVASAAAFEKTLSPDSDEIRTFTFEDFVESIRIGPEPLYRVEERAVDDGTHRWRVVNSSGEPLPSDRAKIVKPPGAVIPRILFRDPSEDVWVDPESFYDFGDERFYDQSTNKETSLTKDLTVRPLQAPAWHGPPTTALLFDSPEGELFMSSDTVYDPDLWEGLTRTRRKDSQRTDESFRDRYRLKGSLEEYVEQTWSERRLQKAHSAYDRDGPCLHDVSGTDSTVHTAYREIEGFDRDLLLTHSPDEFTTVHPLAHLGKSYVLRQGKLLERTKNGDYFSHTATCYVKRYSDYLVGYEDVDGDHYLVREAPGSYEVTSEKPDDPSSVEDVIPIALYRDIGGEYFPVLNDENQEYYLRPDNRVVKLTHGEESTEGSVVHGRRNHLSSGAAHPVTE